MKNQEVTLQFNIFDYGRKVTGNFRRYEVDNVRQVLESAATRERIKLREATGYFGHGRRQITGKLDLSEVETVQTPSGPIVIENIPACVTKAISIDDDGNVSHTQDILTTDPGKAVQALMQSQVGGFSWATGGRDGQRNSPTRLNSYHGMDYVMTPGYSSNRSYQILESAQQIDDERDQIFEAMRSCGLSEEKARLYTDTFTSPYLAAAAASERESELMETTQILESRLVELEGELEAARQAGSDRKSRLMEWAKGYHVVVPDHVLEAVEQGDVNKEIAFFEDVARVNRDKAGTLPLSGGKFIGESVPKPKFGKSEVPGYGSVESAPTFD
ncbi:hypothetical protein [Vreelandella alkaliphila]|uniref:Uncharacterized protein n=1 Tax=Vreelandella alkaliphila TaxID=272774 RepID=A0AAJ2RXI7_9GAMM|nr:hypothetical protein [Halomonas alkaliphila]MDX5979566.1 hypothetical protein [Halomonas alkaliphila]